MVRMVDKFHESIELLLREQCDKLGFRPDPIQTSETEASLFIAVAVIKLVEDKDEVMFISNWTIGICVYSIQSCMSIEPIV